MANAALESERKKDEHKVFLSNEIIELMENLGNIYSEYFNRTHAVREKLKQEIFKYLDEKQLWKDESTISHIRIYLPSSGMYMELDRALYDIMESGEEKQAGLEENPLPYEMIETLMIMRRAYNRNYEKASRIEEKMRKHINRYMTEHNLWENQAAIIEVIETLPACYLRFNFYETYYELEDKKNKVQEGK